MNYYCVASSSPGAASVPCTPDNIGLTQGAVDSLAAALVSVAMVAYLWRVVIRFFLNRG